MNFLFHELDFTPRFPSPVKVKKKDFAPQILTLTHLISYILIGSVPEKSCLNLYIYPRHWQGVDSASLVHGPPPPTAPPPLLLHTIPDDCVIDAYFTTNTVHLQFTFLNSTFKLYGWCGAARPARRQCQAPNQPASLFIKSYIESQ